MLCVLHACSVCISVNKSINHVLSSVYSSKKMPCHNSLENQNLVSNYIFVFCSRAMLHMGRRYSVRLIAVQWMAGTSTL